MSMLLTLLLGHTDGFTAATSRLGVLTAHTQTPVVTETTVVADLLKTLKILAHLVVETVGQDLRVLTILDVLLTIEEPFRDLVLQRVLDNVDQALKLLAGKFTSAVKIRTILSIQVV